MTKPLRLPRASSRAGKRKSRTAAAAVPRAAVWRKLRRESGMGPPARDCNPARDEQHHEGGIGGQRSASSWEWMDPRYCRWALRLLVNLLQARDHTSIVQDGCGVAYMNDVSAAVKQAEDPVLAAVTHVSSKFPGYFHVRSGDFINRPPQQFFTGIAQHL